jgi:hypothetical protein
MKDEMESHQKTNYCKPCRKQYRIDTSLYLSEQRYNLKANYGMTLEEFNKLVETQGNACAICSTSIPGGRGTWHVDHDHKTGKVRGLLCNACNVGLGYFKDSMDNLNNAILYLAGQ